MFFLLILFVVMPITEIMLIINVSDSIGGWNTFLLVLITAFLGAYFVKREGLATLQSVQTKAAQGEMPGSELVQGIMLIVAGVLLVTPGFITDAIGLAFTFPLSRKLIAAYFLKHLLEKQKQGQSSFYFQFGQSNQSRYQQSHNPFEYENNQQDGDIIEGEYQDNSKKDADKDGKNRLE